MNLPLVGVIILVISWLLTLLQASNAVLRSGATADSPIDYSIPYSRLPSMEEWMVCYWDFQSWQEGKEAA